jgi:enamine deaminase RidA (YjgF/YER057c/UK114 family)
MRVEERLKELGIELPPPFEPPAGMNFLAWSQHGNLIFLSGHGPTRGKEVVYRGRVGSDLTLEQGYAAARLTGLNLLATLQAAIGGLDRVRRIVKVLGMVACAENFTQQPAVINGASDLFVEVFGERGRHARSAVGLYALPLGIPVEIEMIVEIEG